MTTLQGNQFKILNLLRHLYDETKNNFVKLSLSGKALEYEVSNPSGFAPKLVSSGILERQGNNPAHFIYKWKCDDKPSIEMVEKFFPEEAKSKSQEPAKKDTTKPTKPVPAIPEQPKTEMPPKKYADAEQVAENLLKLYEDMELIGELKARGYSGQLVKSINL